MWHEGIKGHFSNHINRKVAPVSGTSIGRKKIFFLLGHFEKIKVEEAITKAIRNYCQKKKKKSYHADSKSCGTSNLLTHVPNCLKNPNRED